MEDKIDKFYKFPKQVWIIAFLFIVISFAALPFYKAEITADHISLYSIAEKYITGDYDNAINAYFGPLYSMLLIPFIFLGAGKEFSARYLGCFLGLISIFVFYRFTLVFEIKKKLRMILMWIFFIYSLFFSLTLSTPDLLLTIIITLYLTFLLNKNYLDNKASSLKCGFIGAFAYFAKAFAFPFFIVHFFLSHIAILIANSDRKTIVLKKYAYGMIIFILFSSIWIFTISNRHGRLMFTVTGMKVSDTGNPSDKFMSPIHRNGLFTPPENTYCIWERPDAVYRDLSTYSTFKNFESFKYDIRRASKNFYHLLGNYSRVSSLWLPALIFSLLFAIGKNKLIADQRLFLAAMTVIFYPVGYLTYDVQLRYLWPVIPLFLCLCGFSANYLLDFDFFTPKRKAILLTILIGSFLLFPLNELRFSINKNKESLDISQNITTNKLIPEGSKIASNDDYFKSFYLSFRISSKFYGYLPDTMSEETFEQQLQDHAIEYFIVWKAKERHLSFLEKYEEVSQDKIPKLLIYKIN